MQRALPGAGAELCGQQFLSVQQDLVESRDGKRLLLGADVGKVQGGPPAVELDRALQRQEEQSSATVQLVFVTHI